MPGRIEKTVFISYRRANKYIALAIYQDLRDHNFDVFFDYESINSGDYEQIIIENIHSRAHFIIILTPSALDRCNEPGDWVRREIEAAIDAKRNIVPIMMEGFNFSNLNIDKYLTGKLELLKKYQALEIPTNLAYFKYAMQELGNRYLNVSLDTVLHPLSKDVAEVVQKQQSAANQAKEVQQKQLTAQQWYEKGKSLSKDKNLEEAVYALTKATELDEDLADAWEDKAQLLIQLGRKKEASEAIAKLISFYEKQIEITEAQYDDSRSNWSTQAENDRLFGNPSISMSDYYDSEVLASRRGYLQIEDELWKKIRLLRAWLESVQT